MTLSRRSFLSRAGAALAALVGGKAIAEHSEATPVEPKRYSARYPVWEDLTGGPPYVVEDFDTGEQRVAWKTYAHSVKVSTEMLEDSALPGLLEKRYRGVFFEQYDKIPNKFGKLFR